jgi:hypothetical protein
MTRSIFTTMAFAVCLSGFAVSASADDMDQVRQDCQDEVAGYGIVDVNEQQQAIDDCIAMRVGSSGESEPDMPSSDQGNE